MRRCVEGLNQRSGGGGFSLWRAISKPIPLIAISGCCNMTSQPSPVEAEKASGPLQVRRGSDCKARRENFFPLLLSNRSIEKCISLEFGHVGSRLATQGRQRLIESALSVAGSEREWIAGDTLLLLHGASFFVFFPRRRRAFWLRVAGGRSVLSCVHLHLKRQRRFSLVNVGVNKRTASPPCVYL